MNSDPQTLTAPSAEYAINAKLVRFEDRFAILSSAGLGEFRWPIKNLPDEIQIGQNVILRIGSGEITGQKTEISTAVHASASAGDNDEKYARMRKLLEDLIN